MRRIARYIARSVFGATALVLLVLLSLDLIGGFIEEMGDLGGDYGVLQALNYMLLTLPGRFYDYLPYACLIGCLAGLGMLANASELVVMRAAGVSVKRLCWLVLRPVLVFVVLGLALGEWVVPYTDQLAESRRAVAMGAPRALHIERGLWHREGDTFMHFNAVQPNGVLHGVTRYRLNEQRQLAEVSHTERASYLGDYWQEEDVWVTRLDEEEVTTKNYAQRRWQSELTPALLNIIALPPDGLSLRDLAYYAGYLTEQDLDAGEYRLAFWEKALQPLATISLVLVAISFIFGPLREVTMGQRIFTGVVFGIGFRLVQSLLGPSSLVFGFPPLIAVLLPILACMGLGVYLLNRAR